MNRCSLRQFDKVKLLRKKTESPFYILAIQHNYTNDKTNNIFNHLCIISGRDQNVIKYQVLINRAIVECVENLIKNDLPKMFLCESERDA